MNSVNSTDANAVIANENPYNDPPGNGQYVIVNVTVTNDGASTTVPAIALEFGLVGTDNLLYTEAPEVLPDSLLEEPQVLTGGTVTANVAMDVPPAVIGDSTISVKDGFSDPVYWSQG